MTHPTPSELQEWRRLADKATEGPWESSFPEVVSIADNLDPRSHRMHEILSSVGLPARKFCRVAKCDCTTGDAGQESRNIDFIAAARTAVPALLDALEELTAENERLSGIVRKGLKWWNVHRGYDVDGSEMPQVRSSTIESYEAQKSVDLQDALAEEWRRMGKPVHPQ